MTYRRPPGSFAAAISAAVGAAGAKTAAPAAGVSASRLRQLANPCRRDVRVLDVAAALDAAAHAAGAGTPILETYRARLRALGVPLAPPEARAERLARLARRLARLLERAGGGRDPVPA